MNYLLYDLLTKNLGISQYMVLLFSDGNKKGNDIIFINLDGILITDIWYVGGCVDRSHIYLYYSS